MEAFHAECGAFSDAIGGLDEDDFVRPTNCPPWDLKELIVHTAGSFSVPRRFPDPRHGEPLKDAAEYYRRPERDEPGYRQSNVERARSQASRLATGHDAVADFER